MSEVDRAKLRFRTAAIAGVKTFVEDVAGEAQRRAPIEEGTLRGSADTDVDVVGDLITGEVSFNEVYAARQHEELSWQHPKGGQAKYLESVLLERAPRYAAILRKAIGSAL